MRRDITQRTEETAFRPFQQKALGNRIGFRFADGQMRSLPYLQLIETQFHPDIGVILEFAGHRVTLQGRNLQQLYCELEAEEIGGVGFDHGPGLVDGLNATVVDVGETAEELKAFARTGLPQFRDLAADARKVIASSGAVADRIGRDPSRFLLGNQTPEYRN